MKKVSALFFITLFLLTSSAYALTLSELWKDLDPISKQFIVIGYKEGLKDGLAIAKKPDATEPAEIMSIDTPQHKVADNTYKNIYTTHLKTIVSEMDKFYADDSNRGIPLDYAILYVTQIQNGISEEESQKDLVELKKAISEVEAKYK